MKVSVSVSLSKSWQPQMPCHPSSYLSYQMNLKQKEHFWEKISFCSVQGTFQKEERKKPLFFRKYIFTFLINLLNITKVSKLTIKEILGKTGRPQPPTTNILRNVPLLQNYTVFKTPMLSF